MKPWAASLSSAMALSVSGLAGADAASSPASLSLPDALAYARAHHPAILASAARIQAAETGTRIPRAQWLPTLGATAQLLGGTANNTTGSYVGVGVLDIPRIGGTRSVSSSSATWTPSASSFVGVGVTQEVFDFGRIAAESSAADLRVDVARQAARATRLDVDFDVAEAYFAVHAAKGVLRASEGAVTRARTHRDLAKAGVDSGLRPPIELTRAESELGRFEIGRLRAQGGVTVAQGVLASAVGLEGPTVDVVGEAPAAADLPSLDAALAIALDRDPRVLEALAELRAEEARTRAIGAEERPDLSLTGTLSGRAGGSAPSGNGELPTGDGLLPIVPNWNVGVILSWPIFDGTVRARVDASRAEEAVRREQIVEEKQRTRALVQQAYVAVTVARDALPTLQRNVAAALANYQQADARFTAGLGNAVELADAEALRATAEIELALGVFEVARSRAALGRALAEGSGT